MKALPLSIIAVIGIAVIGAVIFIIIGNINSDASYEQKLHDLQPNLNSEMKCDLSCKTNWENQGRTCSIEPNGNFLCKAASQHSAVNVIPWGSEKMPYKRNFVYNTLTLSLEINNTASWTNADDFPHRIISDDGIFNSGVILPNQTWYHVFDKAGMYNYHGEHPWLKGNVTVVSLDPNYKNIDGEPIWKNTSEPSIIYRIYRNTDQWQYIKQVSVLDKNTVSVSLYDYQSPDSKEITQKTLKIGDRTVESCGVVSGHIQIEYLTLERIVDTGIPFAEFREDSTGQPDTYCSFDDLIKGNK